MLDFRSDTVTLPTYEMREAMLNAELGDDVYGDDPTVNRFERLAADRLGTEAALFVPTGTQSNLVALLSHCQRGEEYIVGAEAHTYKFEGGGAAVLGGIQPQPVPFDEYGRLPPSAIEAHIKPDDFHFARTRLVCLENTQHGRVLPLEYLREVRELVDRCGLALHLDGARVFNAAVALGVPVTEISRYFDTVSVCLSKGLCAPVGSVLCGPERFIHEARRWRKVVGGGMRQAGVIAAAAELALTDMPERLADDHVNADRLAGLLDSLEGVDVNHAWQQTNMVWVRFGVPAGRQLAEFARDRGLLISPNEDGSCRLVTHQGVSADDVQQCAAVIEAYLTSIPAR